MRFIYSSGKAGALPYVVGTIICCPESHSALRGVIPHRLQVHLATSPSWKLLFSEGS